MSTRVGRVAAGLGSLLITAGLVAVVVVPGMLHHDGPVRAADPSGPVSRAPMPVAPDGMVLVGAQGDVIAVPHTWTESQPPACGSPHEPYYYLDEGVPLTFSCPMETGGEQPVSNLDIDPTPDPGIVDGVHCSHDQCVGTWLADQQVAFVATVVGDETAGRALLAQMQASVQHLPEGWTTVPQWVYVQADPPSDPHNYVVESAGAYAAALDRAGLVSVLGQVDAQDGDLGERVTEPAQGALVATGSSVTVGAPAAGSTGPVPPDPSAPAGMKLVGTGGAAIAVPDDWADTEQPLCGGPSSVADAYYFSEAVPDAISCPYAPPPSHDSDHLVITTADALPSDPLAPPPGDEGEVTCDGPTCIAYLTDSAHGVRFVATAYGADARDLLTRIGATVQVLPAGWSTVPLWPSQATHPGPGETAYGPIPVDDYVQLVATAGFTASHPSGPGVPATHEVTPAQGSVVRDGSMVQVEGG